jgi:diguanylate cyclase (GGDEF)-like protein
MVYSVLCIVLVSLCLLQAQQKAPIDIDLLDVFTEGALLILGVSWLILVLLARPRGKVTQLLMTGLLGYCLGSYMDFLDEFFIHNSLPSWFNLLEKIPTPLGVVILTYGLWLWREEQVTINTQLRTREQFYRQHELVDQVTQIYTANAMRHQLSTLLNKNEALTLVMIDLNNFSQVNQQQGFEQGDQILTSSAQLIASQIRSQDLVCRFAGDRFLIMLPRCSPQLAMALANDIIDQMNNLNVDASSATLSWSQSDIANNTLSTEQLISDMNEAMTAVKQARQWPQAI